MSDTIYGLQQTVQQQFQQQLQQTVQQKVKQKVKQQTHQQTVNPQSQYEILMTPAIELAKKTKIAHSVHEYAHDPSSESYGVEAAAKLGVSEDRVFKTLVVSVDNKELVVGVIPVCSLLSMKLIAKAVGAKKAVMASPVEVERSTGYVLGGVSPLGQKKRLKTVIDASAADHATIYVSAGRRGLEIELCLNDLKGLVSGIVAEICQ